MEITINSFARQHVDEKHEFIKETLSTSKEPYRRRLCSLVRGHDFASIATIKLNEENTQVYEQKNRKELYYKRRFAIINRPDFLNPIWRAGEKINRAGKNPAHAQVVK